MITIEMNFAPKSKSNNYRSGKGKFFKSKEIVTQEALIKAAIQSSLPANHVVFTTPVKVTVVLNRSDKRRFDLDNVFKVIFDCMNKVVWSDDNLVQVIHATKNIGCSSPSCIVTVEVI